MYVYLILLLVVVVVVLLLHECTFPESRSFSTSYGTPNEHLLFLVLLFTFLFHLFTFFIANPFPARFILLSKHFVVNEVTTLVVVSSNR